MIRTQGKLHLEDGDLHDEQNSMVASVMSGYGGVVDFELANLDAEHLVLCWNSHDDLVADLADAEERIAILTTLLSEQAREKVAPPLEHLAKWLGGL